MCDTGTQPGGQFWRHRPESVFPEPDGHGHHGWKTYLDLRARFDAAISRGLLRYLPNTQVWMTEREDAGRFVLRLTPATGTAIEAATVRAAKLVSCTGGYDRQLPLPGWELPGVMAAGGIQAFIKANGTLPGKRFVVAGTGPFLLPVAANIAEAGGKVVAVCESASLANWLPHLGAASGVPGKALEGAEYAGIFAKHRIRYRTRTVVTEVLGESSAKSVRIAKVDADGAVIAGTEQLLRGRGRRRFRLGLHPAGRTCRGPGGRTTRIDADGSLVCVVDGQQASNVPGLYLAGEVTGVGGAVLAVAEGLVAGAAAANGEAPSAGTARQIQRHRRFAGAMHRAHPVPEKWDDLLADDTLVCRCEEVSHGEVVHARDDTGRHGCAHHEVLHPHRHGLVPGQGLRLCRLLPFHQGGRRRRGRTSLACGLRQAPRRRPADPGRDQHPGLPAAPGLLSARTTRHPRILTFDSPSGSPPNFPVKGPHPS